MFKTEIDKVLADRIITQDALPPSYDWVDTNGGLVEYHDFRIVK